MLFLLTFFCYSYFIQLDDGANQRSRMALIMSLVQHHQLNIDPYEEHTGDKALYKGYYYSDKVIGTAMLDVPVYAIFHSLTVLNTTSQDCTGAYAGRSIRSASWVWPCPPRS